MNDDGKLAKCLGWFSIGLGAAEILAPRSVARLAGMRNHRILPALGAREIASGIAILTSPRPVGALWSRVGGDAMDLSLLCAELQKDDAEHTRLATTTAAITVIGIVDLLCAQQLSRDDRDTQEGDTMQQPDIAKAITIDRSADDLYRFWRDFENLPRIMPHLESVKTLSNGRSRWRALAPMGAAVEWEADVTEDIPNERISWQSVEGSQVNTRGDVRFHPATGGRGTVVSVTLDYDPPGGVLGKAAAIVTRENPERQIYEALRSFKQIMELGEVTRSEGTVIGRTIEQKPGRPDEERIAA